MPATTSRNGLRTPLSTEAPDAPGQITNLAADVEQYIGGIGVEYCANLAAVQAIPAARTYTGKRALAADTQAIYRWSGTTWQPWEFLNIPSSTFAASENGANFDTSGGQFEANITAGMLTLNFNLYRSGGLAVDTAYLRMQPGYRPAGSVNLNGYTENGATRAVGAFVLDNTGGLVLKTNGGASATTYRGTAMYRVAN